MSALGRIAAVARIELLRLRRSQITFLLLLIVPAMQVLLFGYAIRPGAANVSVVIAAPSSSLGDSIAKSLREQPGLNILSPTRKPGGAEQAVRARQALIGIEVSEQRSMANPFAVQQPVRVIVDGTNAALTAAAVPRIETAYWHVLTVRADAQDSGPGLRVERLYNPQARADWTFLPALIGVTVMISMIMLGSLSLARERETGTWESLIMLPIRPLEVMAGKLLPYALIGTVQGALVLGAGVWLFALPVRGSAAALLALLPLFALAHLVMGYAIAVRASTQLAALQGAVAFYLPAMLLSGFLYPFETLPGWAQAIGQIFPLTHLIRASQGGLLRGDDWTLTISHGLPIIVFLGGAGLAALVARPRNLD
jgi:ABC-2 type transport system permease protein